MKKTIYTFTLFALMPYFMIAQSGKTINYSCSNPNRDPSPGNNGAVVTLSYLATSGGRHSYRYIFDAGAMQYVDVIYQNSRWEIVARDGGTSDLWYYSTVQSTPNPPNLSFGAWKLHDGSNATDITSFSGTGTQSSITLPIELTQFNVQNIEGGKTHLTWTTASEKDNSHFDIERSTDGSTFHSIGQVKGNNKPSSYQFVDNQSFATSYYRLRQIDFDGTETVSKVVSVEQKSKGKGLTIYPTLVSNGILTVDTEGGDYSIYNIVGQQVQNGKTTQRLDVSALAKGTYYPQSRYRASEVHQTIKVPFGDLGVQ